MIPEEVILVVGGIFTVIVGIFAVYLFFRIASAAWYRSMFEVRNRQLKRKEKNDGTGK